MILTSSSLEPLFEGLIYPIVRSVIRIVLDMQHTSKKRPTLGQSLTRRERHLNHQLSMSLQNFINLLVNR